MSDWKTTGWYLNEWLSARGVRQIDIVRETGWSKQHVSHLCNGRIKYTQNVVEHLAKVFGVQPYELLMHPNLAKRLRNLLDNTYENESRPPSSTNQ